MKKSQAFEQMILPFPETSDDIRTAATIAVLVLCLLATIATCDLIRCWCYDSIDP